MNELDLKYLTHTFTSNANTIGALAAGGWDVPRIRAAKTSHELGRFVGSAALGQAFKSDARVFGAWAQRVGAPLSLARTVDPPKGLAGDELAEAARADGERLFAPTSTACGPDVVSSIFTRIPMWGFTWLQNIWTPRADGSRIDVTVKPWPIQATWYDSNRECYMASTKDGDVEMRHGDGKWIKVEPYGEQSYLSGSIIPLGLLFADRGWGVRDRSNFSGAHGSPGVKGKLPPGEVPDSDVGRAYLAEMAKLQQPRAQILEPDGAATSYIEAMSSTWQIFGQIINGDAADIAIALLGQDGTSQNAGGTYTKALILQNVLYDLVDKDVGSVGSSLTTGLILPYTIVNRGRDDISPSIKWHMPKPVEDARLAEIAARSKALREEVQGYRDLGIPVDEQRLAAERGVSIPLLSGAAWPSASPAAPARSAEASIAPAEDRLAKFYAMLTAAKAAGFAVDDAYAAAIANQLGLPAPPPLAPATSAGVEVFAYDLEGGVVTRGTAAAIKGLPPPPFPDETVPEFRARIAREDAQSR